MSNYRSPVWKITNEEFKNLVERNISFTEIIKSVGLKNKGGNFKTVQNRIARDGLDDSHIRKNRYASRPSFLRATKDTVQAYFIDNSNTRRSVVRNNIIKFKLLEYKCNCCGIEAWQNKKLSLQLDHINGKYNDHRLENLRFLCPNCHSQTDTFAGRANKKTCIRPKGDRFQARPNQRKIKNRPTKEEILTMLETMSYCAVGRKYGVSDNAIRKWLK